MVSLELTDIQGNILHGYGFPRAAYRFFEIPDADSGRAFLDSLVDEVTNAKRWNTFTEPTTATNVALTYSGLRALGVADTVLAALPESFSEPIRERARRVLGDVGQSDPRRWVQGLGTERSHVLVMVHGNEGVGADDEFSAAVELLETRAIEQGLTIVHEQDAEALDNRREHFGWADGFGQPSIEGAGKSRAGQGVPQADGITWRDLKAGEFVHGYGDEDDQIVSGPAAPLLRNGTYMVYRKLYQDVALFEAGLREDAVRYGSNVPSNPPLEVDHLIELMAAKIVGRWRDGAAIELEPNRRPVRSLLDEAERDPDNDFRYFAEDFNGVICPRGAHIRRTNPRDALGWDGSLTRRHRIIRRGMPYGRALDSEHANDDGEDRGLIFICMNADFERQFEFIQSQWCNDGNAFGLGTEQDYLLGDKCGAGKSTIPGDPPHILATKPNVVTTRGSEYLLMPGLRVLGKLAGR